MSDVEFEDDYTRNDFHIRSRKILGEPTTPSIITFLLDKKVVKNEKQATVIISILIVILLVVSGLIINHTLNPPEEDLIVIDKFGREIPFDEYIDMLVIGQDPLR